MKTFSICVPILLSLFLLANFCYAAEENKVAILPTQGADMTENGEEAKEEKFKFLPHHIPFYKKPFFKPIPHHPVLKKPFPKPHYPPVFPSHP
ncbi:unnamed protein product [Citrullus colocynthis]|uniref:Uncharacterized protein n=1 Tax=Citrullus colocynthis TaxID=252529 RepID=A0ABP0Y9B7_9ROSI